MFLLWHPWLTTTNLSYSFPLLETSATALCGTTGSHIPMEWNRKHYRRYHAHKPSWEWVCQSTGKGAFLQTDSNCSYFCVHSPAGNRIKGTRCCCEATMPQATVTWKISIKSLGQLELDGFFTFDSKSPNQSILFLDETVRYHPVRGNITLCVQMNVKQTTVRV